MFYHAFHFYSNLLPDIWVGTPRVVICNNVYQELLKIRRISVEDDDDDDCDSEW